MTGYEFNVSRDLLPELLGSQDGLAKLVESVLNPILEAQVSESLGADRHERSEERQGYRNGYRVRTLYTRVGPVTLQVPQTRKVSVIADGLCGASFSKSTVNALCAGLDPRVRTFNERRFDGNYPFMMVDTMFIRSREDD